MLRGPEKVGENIGNILVPQITEQIMELSDLLVPLNGVWISPCRKFMEGTLVAEANVGCASKKKALPQQLLALFSLAADHGQFEVAKSISQDRVQHRTVDAQNQGLDAESLKIKDMLTISWSLMDQSCRPTSLGMTERILQPILGGSDNMVALSYKKTLAPHYGRPSTIHNSCLSLWN